VYSPADAGPAGFLDQTVPPGEVVPAARAMAEQLSRLDRAAHAATKRRVRPLAAIRQAIEEDRGAIDRS
jgi:enoyl-CoA hydratase